MRLRRNEAGVAHILVIVLVVVAGALIISSVLDSPANRNATTQAGQLAADGHARVDVPAVAAALDPSIVDIRATLSGGRGRVAGTGVVLSASGSILTNNHVIAGANAITAQVAGAGRSYVAHVVGYDVSDDIALLQLDDAHDLTAAPLDPSTAVGVGDGIVVIGNAHGLGGTPRATGGSVHALGQRVSATDDQGDDREALSDMIEVTAAVEPGDSGGALVDANGRVVGIVTAASVTSAADAGSGFAIPIARATAVADQIAAGRSSATVHAGLRAVLGVTIKSPRSTTKSGAVVGLIDTDSSTRAVGLQRDDVIVSADGRAVQSAGDLNVVLDRHRPGDVVALGWIDGGGHFRTGSVRLVVGPPL